MGVSQLIVVALTSLLLASCGDAGQSNRGEIASTISVVADTAPQEWREGAMFAIDNADTLSRRDIYIFVRHQPQRNLESVNVRIYTSAPDHTIHIDEVTLPLDNSSKGRRGSLKINHLLYRSDVVWSQRGVYNIDLFPLIPDGEVGAIGVEAIGVEIQTYKQ